MTPAPERTLGILLAGELAGTVSQLDDGRLQLDYDRDWLGRRSRTPLSLSLPLTEASHGDRPVRAFLWGLLPDNEQVLDRWARDYQVSAGNPFAILRHVGEDCAGAVQLAPTDRTAELLAGEGGVDWIDEVEIGRRIARLRQDPAAWHTNTTGQFSLAGAQAKTALHYDAAQRRWGDPWGAVPTTHIIKPAVVGFDDHDLNEHLCLHTARLLGLPAARTWVGDFDGERAIVVERYDRSYRDGQLHRLHQEDMCQALGVLPTIKYQSEGGPSPEGIIALLRRAAAELAVSHFIDALAFNWLIGGTDAHAKNYSVLLQGPRVRLAPLYDVASTLPYDDMYEPKLKLAMRLGGEYRLSAVTGKHWRRFAVQNDVDPAALLTRISELATELPGALRVAITEQPITELPSTLPGRLLDRVADRVRRCQRALAERAAG
ncbi:type II toxin-antitoxin system HipA family toxin [Natronosporangium hydrolyticum]|uniref:Type II toxin-antitoxin system HipA family toxin n=1 Tax=Natronosporangium hydrolyticum TaxID=2811111 RepID=A0A895YCE9_9ACTN|nr:type II toxin-antitoxin system HipA family toxin [Natronosporangium hydrolyticum]QSB15467.1 type II toxin-antitoxin system HipA family toxin [Natronosporangium hydrolyticum]